MQLSGKTYGWTLLSVFALALGLRVGVTQAFQGLGAPLDRGAFPDQCEYEMLAHSLHEGNGYAYADGKPTALRTPGTSLTILPMYYVFGRSFTAARLWMCVISAATCLAAAWLAGALFGRLAGVFSGAILALDPGHFYYAQHLVSEVPFGFFTVLGTLFAYHGLTLRRRWVGWSVAAGTTLGFAMLVRPQLVLLFPLGALVALFVHADVRARVWKAVALQAACAALVLMPWVVRNAVVMGAPTLGAISGLLFWGTHNKVVVEHPWTVGSWMPVDDLLPEDWPEDELEANAYAWRAGFEYLEQNPEVIPSLVFHKLRRFFSPYAGTRNRLLKVSWATAWWITGPLFLFGLVIAWRRYPTASILLASHLLIALAITVLFSGAVRYRHTLNPLIAVYAGLSLAAMVDAWRGVGGRSPRVSAAPPE